jgi:hypothetical protein
MSGYSSTPLAKKLGYKSDCEVFLINAPADYQKWVAPLPAGVRFVQKVSKSTDLIHHFSTSQIELTKSLKFYRTKVKPDATIWVSWPKKAAKVDTDITEDVIREVALPMDYVDIKVCAVSEIWSGLKLVIRKELR